MDKSLFLVFLRASSRWTPKSFACLRRLVTHSNKVYRIVNDARYIILIFIHCCTAFICLSLFCLILWVNSELVTVTPAAGWVFSSGHAKLSKPFIWYNILSSSVSAFSFFYPRLVPLFALFWGIFTDRTWTELLQNCTRSGTSRTRTSREITPFSRLTRTTTRTLAYEFMTSLMWP